MNSAEHKAKAEAILNRIEASTVMYPERLLQAAQVHATLATIADPTPLLHGGTENKPTRAPWEEHDRRQQT